MANSLQVRLRVGHQGDTTKTKSPECSQARRRATDSAWVLEIWPWNRGAKGCPVGLSKNKKHSRSPHKECCAHQAVPQRQGAPRGAESQSTGTTEITLTTNVIIIYIQKSIKQRKHNVWGSASPLPNSGHSLNN